MQRTCSVCGVTHDMSEFYRDASSVGGHEYRCKACARKHRRKMLERQIKRRLRLVQRLKEQGCRICGSTDPYILEFHHVISADRVSISRMVYGAYGEQAFLEELTKCVVLCANDHKRVHADVLDTNHVPRYTVDELRELLEKEDE